MIMPLDYQSQPVVRASKMWLVAILAAWIVGFQLWLLTDFWLVRSMSHLTVYAGAVAVCFIEPVRRALFALGRMLDHRGRLATPLIFAIMSTLALAILYATAIDSSRRFSPVFHDEFSYLLQATMLAHGHLSMPAHPLGAFFDTFYVITDRAYASQYFPGAAMMFAPGVWLGLDGWVMPLIIASAAAGMLFLVIRELFDGLCGLASIIVLCGVLGFRFLSIIPVAQVPALLLGLIATYVTLRWIATRRFRWILAGGTAIGWMAITRPLDAVVYAVPLGALILFYQVRAKADGANWRKLILAGMLPMLPFLTLQLLLNHQVTGDWLKTPFSYYADRDLPGTSYGFHTYDPNARPASPLPQKQIFYELRVMPTLKVHSPGRALRYWVERRARITMGDVAGDMLLFIPIPAALICLRDPRRWALVSIIAIWCVAYSFYAFDYAHYYVTVLPSIPVLIFAGFESITRVFPRAGELVKCFRVIIPSTIAVMVLPQFKADVIDQFVDSGIEDVVRQFEAKVPDDRSILMVRWGAQSVPEWEVVYNIHDSWPDDARVIRAQDLGADRNIELYRYYAQRQPDRVVYLYDRGAGTFSRIGPVTELLKTSDGEGDSIQTSRPVANDATAQQQEEQGEPHP